MKSLNPTLDEFQETIFSTMTNLALEHNALNLSQGFPDFEGPTFLKEISVKTFQKSDPLLHQYAPSPGKLGLRNQLSFTYKKTYNLGYDPSDEITITDGCTEAIFISTLALLRPGDEVIVFEPYYDSYLASIRLAGAVPKFVTLRTPDWSFEAKDLEDALSSKTKMLFLNNPHNPSGKVYSKEELEIISKFVNENDLYVLSDEVYEYLTFDGHEHTPFASMPGMHERTLTLSSFGKTFGNTGWKLGWILTSKNLTHAVRKVKQFSTFCTNNPLQTVAQEALKQLPGYLPEFRKVYQEKRDLLIDGLNRTPFKTMPSQGTYFVCAEIPDKSSNDKDFCLELIKKAQVALIPTSVFYSKSKQGQRIVRFCFAKKDDTLRESLKRLESV